MSKLIRLDHSLTGVPDVISAFMIDTPSSTIWILSASMQHLDCCKTQTGSSVVDSKGLDLISAMELTLALPQNSIEAESIVLKCTATSCRCESKSISSFVDV